jgi:hypothetical protein
MKELISRILEGGPLTVGVVGLDIIVLLAIIGLAIWARRRSVQLTGYLAVLALVPALLSMALALLFLAELPSNDEWITQRLAHEYPDFMDPAGQFLAGADLIRLVLYSGFIATMLSVFAAYGSRKPRGRMEHGVGMVIGGVLGAITFWIGRVLIPEVIRSFESIDVLDSRPPPAFGREFTFAAVTVAVVFIASVVLVLRSFLKFRNAR